MLYIASYKIYEFNRKFAYLIKTLTSASTTSNNSFDPILRLVIGLMNDKKGVSDNIALCKA